MIREMTGYQVVCDGPDCKYNTGDLGEYAFWGDRSYAEEDWTDGDMQLTSDGKHFCDEHRVNECSDCDRTDNLVNDDPDGESGDWWCRDHVEVDSEGEVHFI